MPLEYKDKEVERLLQQMYRSGFTQEGVNEIYRRLGIANPPTVPSSLVGSRPGAGRAASLIMGANGTRTRTKEEADFFNLLAGQTQDPYRVQSDTSRLAGGVLSAVGTAVGGPVWTAMTAGADYGNRALGNESSSSDMGEWGQYGQIAGTLYNVAGGPGSYSARTAPTGTGGAIDESGAMGGATGRAGGNTNVLSGVGSGGSMGWDWGTLLEYGVPIIGGLLESDGAKDAARASSQASQAAINEQRRQYDTTRQDLMPWMDAGRNALTQLQNPSENFSASPDYEFRRNEGLRGRENWFASRGGAASGNALRALNEFNSANASSEFGNWWNRQAGLAGVGQAATTNVANYGANSANNIGSLLQSQGNARASGIEGSTNAGTNTLANLLAIWQRRNGSTLGA